VQEGTKGVKLRGGVGGPGVQIKKGKAARTRKSQTAISNWASPGSKTAGTEEIGRQFWNTRPSQIKNEKSKNGNNCFWANR